jgi:hypothetical protein
MIEFCDIAKCHITEKGKAGQFLAGSAPVQAGARSTREFNTNSGMDEEYGTRDKLHFATEQQSKTAE